MAIRSLYGFWLNLIFGIVFSIQIVVYVRLLIKFPLKDEFIRKASFWNVVGMSTRTFMCFAIVIYESSTSIIIKKNNYAVLLTTIDFEVPFFLQLLVIIAIIFSTLQMYDQLNVLDSTLSQNKKEQTDVYNKKLVFGYKILLTLTSLIILYNIVFQTIDGTLKDAA